MQVHIINSRLDSRLGVMAPMTTSKNTASCILRTYSLFTWSSLLSFFYLLKSVHKDYLQIREDLRPNVLSVHITISMKCTFKTWTFRKHEGEKSEGSP